MKTALDSINLFSSVPEKLKQFYIDVFGLRENAERSHPPGFFLLEGQGGSNLLIQKADLVDGTVGHSGFELGFEMQTISGVGVRAMAAGGSIVNDTQQMGWGDAITVADPEGHRVNAYVFGTLAG